MNLSAFGLFDRFIFVYRFCLWNMSHAGAKSDVGVKENPEWAARIDQAHLGGLGHANGVVVQWFFD
ncbi:hypothetical protein BCEP27_50386 [Burkholderia cepacia]